MRAIKPKLNLLIYLTIPTMDLKEIKLITQTAFKFCMVLQTNIKPQ